MASAEEHIIAVNIDLALIVVSVASPPFHPKLIDRYLVMCQYGNVKPSICLTKTDLGPEPDLSVYRSLGLDVFEVSNTTRKGIVELAGHLRGKRCVLVGHSGVGKSSLVNNLLEKEIIPVGSVGEKSGKGKHTTSNSSLHVIGHNTFLIDTPGIRSLGLWNVDRLSLRLYFPEFSSFADSCQYKDCSHSHEPDCGVKKAVEDGEIARERYDSYIRLLGEQK
jgi:ribosome biogenesis GTPase